MAKKENIASRVKEAVKPLVEGAGYTLWDVTFYKEVSEWILEVSIDKEEGISTDDCSLVTKLIDPIIDEIENNTTREADQTQASAFWGRKEISLKDVAVDIAFAVAVITNNTNHSSGIVFINNTKCSSCFL